MACSGVIIDPSWMYMMWKQSSLYHRRECLKTYGWQWKICDALTIQFDSIQLDELSEVWREYCSAEVLHIHSVLSVYWSSMYFTPHGVNFYFLHSMFLKFLFVFFSVPLFFSRTLVRLLSPLVSLDRKPEMQKEVAVVACANIQSILSSKEREAYMMNTENWTTVLSHNLRNVHNTRWKTNLMRRRPYQFTESLQNTFYNLICCALLLLFASNVHSLYSRLVHAFHLSSVRVRPRVCVCALRAFEKVSVRRRDC